MINTETEISPTPPRRKKRRIFLWALLIIILLAMAGAVAITHYPFLYSPPVAENASDVAALQRRVEILETRIETLAEAPAAQPAPASNDAALTDTVKNLQAQITAMQGQQSSRKWIGAVMAFWDLRDAVENGRNFSQQLAAFRATANDDAAILAQAAKLEPYANEATPTLPQLREALLAQESVMAVSAENTRLTIWGHIRALFQPLISVRSLHDARYAMLENALADDNSQAAFDAFKNLPDEAQKKLSAWENDLEKRIALDHALRELETSLGDAP